MAGKSNPWGPQSCAAGERAAREVTGRAGCPSAQMSAPPRSVRNELASKWKLVLVFIPLPADRFHPAY